MENKKPEISTEISKKSGGNPKFHQNQISNSAEIQQFHQFIFLKMVEKFKIHFFFIVKFRHFRDFHQIKKFKFCGNPTVPQKKFP